jgi:hypothetical protein
MILCIVKYKNRKKFPYANTQALIPNPAKPEMNIED